MKITKIREVKTPTRGTECSAGLDFYVPAGIRLCMLPGDDVLIPSGIKVEVPQTKWIRVVNPNEEYEECLDSDGDYPNISGHLTISVQYGRWVFDFDKEGINGRKPQDTSFTEAAIKMAEFCIENELI